MPRHRRQRNVEGTGEVADARFAPGKPRQEIDPWEQIRHISHAITYAQSRDDVDPARIGLWGSSYGAANAYVTAAIDRRVKAVCGQVPLISGRRRPRSRRAAPGRHSAASNPAGTPRGCLSEGTVRRG